MKYIKAHLKHAPDTSSHILFLSSATLSLISLITFSIHNISKCNYILYIDVLFKSQLLPGLTHRFGAVKTYGGQQPPPGQAFKLQSSRCSASPLKSLKCKHCHKLRNGNNIFRLNLVKKEEVSIKTFILASVNPSLYIKWY